MLPGWRFFQIVVFSSLNAQSHLDILDSLYMTHYEEEGSEIKGTIYLLNAGDEVLKIKIYPKDYSMNLRGDILFPEPGMLARSNASWVQLPYTYLEVPPFAYFPVNYVLKIPKDSSLQGSYWSVIMLESSEDAHATSVEGTTIQALKRIAYQVIAEVGDLGICKINVLEKRVEVSPETKILAFDVENSGTLTLKLQPFVEILDLEGKSLGLFSCQRQMIHPLSSSRFSVDISSIAPQSTLAKTLFKHDGESVFASQYAIEVPDFLPKISKRRQE